MPTDDPLIPARDEIRPTPSPTDAEMRPAEHIWPPVPDHSKEAITPDVPVDHNDVPLVLPAPRKPHPGFWWAVLWCIGFLIVTQFIPGFVVPLVILIADISSAPNLFEALEQLQQPDAVRDLQNRSLLPMVVMSEFLVIGVSWLVIRVMVGKDWKRRLALRRPAVLHVLLVLLGLPALMVVANIAYLQFQRFIPGFKDWGFPDIGEVMEQTKWWPWQIAVLLIGLGPGIGEELWCRGFLGNGLVGRYGVVVGVVFTSFFFGIIHVDPPHAAIAMCLGFTLHFVYLTSRSLWLSMLLHFLNNSLAILSLSQTVPKNRAFDTLQDVMKVLDPEENKAPGELLVAASLALGAVALALYQTRARIVALDVPGKPVWRPAYPGVEGPPPGSGAVVARSRLRLELAALVVVTTLGFWGSVLRILVQ